MAGDAAYTHEKFRNALRTMVLEDGTLRERLCRASMDELIHAWPLDPGAHPQISDELQREVEGFIAKIDPPSEEANTMGEVIASMSDPAIFELADELMTLTFQLRDALHE
jgi:hypothetical protein